MTQKMHNQELKNLLKALVIRVVDIYEQVFSGTPLPIDNTHRTKTLVQFEPEIRKLQVKL